MAMRGGRRLHGLAVLAVLTLGACGREAESAGDDESIRVSPPAEAPSAEAPAGTPLAEAPLPEEPEAEAPAAEPAPARPAERPAPTPRRREPAPSPAAEPEAPAPEPSPEPLPEPEPAVRVVPAGSTLELALETALSTEENDVGDTFWATVTEDVLGEQSEVLIPLGSRVRGRVVESMESPSSEQPAVLTLEIESVTMDGAVRPLRATVVDVEMEADARDSDGRTAVKVGVGAAAGAALGRILGKDRGAAVTGAVAGAAAGTAVALATRDGQATIAQGARLVIRLNDPLIVDR